MKNSVQENIDNKFKIYLISACDIIMLNACLVSLYYGLCINQDLLLVLLIFNAISIVALRYYLSNALQIPWLYSPFNRALKRTTDICMSILFLLTIFPLIYVFQTICTKKCHGGPILESCRIKGSNDKVFTAIKFRKNSFCDKTYLRLTPIVYNVILGHFSSWEIKHIQEISNSTEGALNFPEETHTTENANISANNTFTQSDYTENINAKD